MVLRAAAALLRRSQSTAADAAQWGQWAALENSHLNWMRNALSASGGGVRRPDRFREPDDECAIDPAVAGRSGLGIALIHFRREVDRRPPLGGLVLVGLGLGYGYAGAAVHLVATARLRRVIGLSAPGAAFSAAHALAPPAALTAAALCFADRAPHWLVAAAAAALPDKDALPPTLRKATARPAAPRPPR